MIFSCRWLSLFLLLLALISEEMPGSLEEKISELHSFGALLFLNTIDEVVREVPTDCHIPKEYENVVLRIRLLPSVTDWVS